MGAHSVSQAVLLRSSEGPASTVLYATGAVLPVVGFDVQAGPRNGGRPLQPSQSFGHRRVGQDVAEGQFGPCGIHHAVQLVPIAGKPRLVDLRGHGPTRRGVEFMAEDGVRMVRQHEVLGGGSITPEGGRCKIFLGQPEVRFS